MPDEVRVVTRDRFPVVERQRRLGNRRSLPVRRLTGFVHDLVDNPFRETRRRLAEIERDSVALRTTDQRDEIGAMPRPVQRIDFPVALDSAAQVVFPAMPRGGRIHEALFVPAPEQAAELATFAIVLGERAFGGKQVDTGVDETLIDEPLPIEGIDDRSGRPGPYRPLGDCAQLAEVSGAFEALENRLRVTAVRVRTPHGIEVVERKRLGVFPLVAREVMVEPLQPFLEIHSGLPLRRAELVGCMYGIGEPQYLQGLLEVADGEHALAPEFVYLELERHVGQVLLQQERETPQLVFRSCNDYLPIADRYPYADCPLVVDAREDRVVLGQHRPCENDELVVVGSSYLVFELAPDAAPVGSIETEDLR